MLEVPPLLDNMGNMNNCTMCNSEEATMENPGFKQRKTKTLDVNGTTVLPLKSEYLTARDREFEKFGAMDRVARVLEDSDLGNYEPHVDMVHSTSDSSGLFSTTSEKESDQVDERSNHRKFHRTRKLSRASREAGNRNSNPQTPVSDEVLIRPFIRLMQKGINVKKRPKRGLKMRSPQNRVIWITKNGDELCCGESKRYFRKSYPFAQTRACTSTRQPKDPNWKNWVDIFLADRSALTPMITIYLSEGQKFIKLFNQLAQLKASNRV